MSKGLKRLLITSGIIAAVIIVLIAGFNIFINCYFFEYYEVTNISQGDLDEAERLHSEGYSISCPHFHNITSFNSSKEAAQVYGAINSRLMTYCHEVAEKYHNYAKLGYTVDIKGGETLTVAFTGTGYFYDEREPEPINKTFVFDIKGVSPNKLPMLISE